jgi:DNA modification methylase
MHKMMQLISNVWCKKNMLPFMQIHVHYVNLMKKKITWKFQSFEILKQKVAREMIPLVNNLGTFLYPLGSKFLTLNAHHSVGNNNVKKHV